MKKLDPIEKSQLVWSVLDNSTLLHRLAIRAVEILRDNENKNKNKENKNG